MIFSYKCSCGERSELLTAPGKAPRALSYPCEKCCGEYQRDFQTDFETMTICTNDPYRAYYLNSKGDAEAVRQQRKIDAPRDSFEKAFLEKTYGRKYIGDDISGMTPRAQRAILNNKDRIVS